mmetsp:Transcript_17770/g.55124  ORF Transcript_17770/g.55124 Transcript_17770/m.55124 type:complete len:391 (+) Transcript_17770:2239-3411(+)
MFCASVHVGIAFDLLMRSSLWCAQRHSRPLLHAAPSGHETPVSPGVPMASSSASRQSLRSRYFVKMRAPSTTTAGAPSILADTMLCFAIALRSFDSCAFVGAVLAPSLLPLEPAAAGGGGDLVFAAGAGVGSAAALPRFTARASMFMTLSSPASAAGGFGDWPLADLAVVATTAGSGGGDGDLVAAFPPSCCRSLPIGSLVPPPLPLAGDETGCDLAGGDVAFGASAAPPILSWASRLCVAAFGAPDTSVGGDFVLGWLTAWRGLERLLLFHQPRITSFMRQMFVAEKRRICSCSLSRRASCRTNTSLPCLRRRCTCTLKSLSEEMMATGFFALNDASCPSAAAIWRSASSLRFVHVTRTQPIARRASLSLELRAMSSRCECPSTKYTCA